jgi:hypothetical protein
MSLPTLDLDDRNFDDLLREGLSLLPTVAPEWTNHNPSDPGVTIIELLAYFTEILIYRIGRISPTSKLQFLKLLAGPNWEGLHQGKKLQFLRLLMGDRGEDSNTLETAKLVEIEKAIDCAVIKAGPDELSNAIDYIVHDLAHNECAVTAADFQRFAYEAVRAHHGAEWPIRTLCVPSVDLESNRSRSATRNDSAHVTIVVVPGVELETDEMARLNQKVKDDLLQRCLITTRVHVVAPIYLCIAIRAKLVLKPGHSIGQVSGPLEHVLKRRFGPNPGQGPEGKGWPFGRPLHISELIEAFDETPGVEYVEDVAILQMTTECQNLDYPESALGIQIAVHSTIGVDTLLGGPRSLGRGRLRRNDDGKLVSILLRPWELLRVSVAAEDILSIAPQKNGEYNE